MRRIAVKRIEVFRIAAAIPVAIACLVAAGCGPAEPDPAPRVLGVVPEGDGVAPDQPGIAVRFSEPVEPGGVEDGRFVALAADADAKSVATAAATATGIGPGAAVVPARVALGAGGAEATVTPAAPLQPLAAYAVVVGTGIRSLSGKAVLDPTGRKRAFAATVRTGVVPDRVAPVARWLSPPHGPVPSNLREIRIGFSEPVTGSLSLRGVPGRSRAVAPDVLALGLDGPVAPGPLAPALDDVRDGGANRPLPL
ncbi:MAG TPA: Ig-like domain-containing protein, partial [Anaeromyxobacteraceae bacterium]|nr:Ig-like domain-containing protein [Anaeromyxobacteraceae bacterium]